jgi:hypothetical protein
MSNPWLHGNDGGASYLSAGGSPNFGTIQPIAPLDGMASAQIQIPASSFDNANAVPSRPGEASPESCSSADRAGPRAWQAGGHYNWRFGEPGARRYNGERLVIKPSDHRAASLE